MATPRGDSNESTTRTAQESHFGFGMHLVGGAIRSRVVMSIWPVIRSPDAVVSPLPVVER